MQGHPCHKHTKALYAAPSRLYSSSPSSWLGERNRQSLYALRITSNEWQKSFCRSAWCYLKRGLNKLCRVGSKKIIGQFIFNNRGTTGKSSSSTQVLSPRSTSTRACCLLQLLIKSESLSTWPQRKDVVQRRKLMHSCWRNEVNTWVTKKYHLVSGLRSAILAESLMEAIRGLVSATVASVLLSKKSTWTRKPACAWNRPSMAIATLLMLHVGASSKRLHETDFGSRGCLLKALDQQSLRNGFWWGILVRNWEMCFLVS